VSLIECSSAVVATLKNFGVATRVELKHIDGSEMFSLPTTVSYLLSTVSSQTPALHSTQPQAQEGPRLQSSNH